MHVLKTANFIYCIYMSNVASHCTTARMHICVRMAEHSHKWTQACIHTHTPQGSLSHLNRLCFFVAYQNSKV